MSKISTIDEYISTFPQDIQKKLLQLRNTILRAAPNAIEAINYGIPTYKLNGNLVHFAAYKSHIGFYPAPSGLAAFKEEVSAFKSSKGAVQFPIDKPLPVKLITAIVKFRVKENLNK
ncbi:MAG: DUF1801 domain-containing protein [Ignavibacteriaceae bacterium]|nr:DUF1801 domain-containing protein [Ignavibacteriaceae bacterium]HRI45478.1 DUF1801 domain-containing protein [Ignavibacteriaceae bacterium]